MPTDYTRLTVNVNAETRAAIKALAEKWGVSYTEVVRRALALLGTVDDEIGQGHTIQIRDGENVREVLLFF